MPTLLSTLLLGLSLIFLSPIISQGAVVVPRNVETGAGTSTSIVYARNHVLEARSSSSGRGYSSDGSSSSQGGATCSLNGGQQYTIERKYVAIYRGNNQYDSLHDQTDVTSVKIITIVADSDYYLVGLVVDGSDYEPERQAWVSGDDLGFHGKWIVLARTEACHIQGQPVTLMEYGKYIDFLAAIESATKNLNIGTDTSTGGRNIRTPRVLGRIFAACAQVFRKSGDKYEKLQ